MRKNTILSDFKKTMTEIDVGSLKYYEIKNSFLNEKGIIIK